MRFLSGVVVGVALGVAGTMVVIVKRMTGEP